MSSAASAPRDPQVSIEDLREAERTLARVGTCLAWQWMCSRHCGYTLSINRDAADITRAAALHLAVCDG